MNIKKMFEYQEMNKGKIFEPCMDCCIMKCGLFGDAEKQCHCGNFENTECKKCKHENICF